ncbi:phosphotransferase family protein [Sphingomonas sp. ID0503]|uniref:phosphotransferase family protein n=1 Tax=Sphingomonas sp. ID0503 TaxID=3399691 RepID=UPI003AFA4D48
MIETWRDAIDLEALGRWMDGKGLGSGAIENPRLLAGGTQNLILMFERADRRYVLRRPSAHPRPAANETIRREIRVLGALADTDVPHPRLIASSPEEEALGAAFYLMEPIDGFNVTVGMPALHAADPAIRRDMGFALVDGIARLGRVDHVAVGLADFGRTEGYLERQVGRWRKQLEGYSEHAGWPGQQVLPGVVKVGAWLEANRPATFAPGILHGDYHLANVMYRNDGPGLAAIVDWELATIGDPLIDLGWVLTTWPRAGDPTSMKIEPWDGFPTADELLAYYRERSERDLSAIDWYVVLACYKLAILLEGTSARALAGKADQATGARFHARSVALFERALTLI